MLAHRLEVPVIVQQDVAVADAERGYDHVDGAADRNRSLAQGAMVLALASATSRPSGLTKGSESSVRLVR